MVQRPCKTFLDTRTSDDWPDLANSLPNHFRHVPLRVRAGDPQEGAAECGLAVRHQLRGESEFHADSVRDAESAASCHRHPDRVGHDHLDDDGDLEALSLGGGRSTALFRLGVDSDCASTEHHVVELGGAPMIRLGLCCIFVEQPIKFRNTTVKAVSSMQRDAALVKLSDLCMANAEALRRSLQFCADHGIGCFRINSQILPVKTHAECGYDMADLPEGDEIVRQFQECGEFARSHNIRTCFHPDQFVVLNSQKPDVVKRSIAELEYQSEVAEWVGADVVNIHGGGAYGNKSSALDDFARTLDRLTERVRTRLTVENDDVTYTPSDLLPICRSEGIPLVYDVHHHRCNPDDLSCDEATEQAVATWNREPMFHISSPLEGWKGTNPRRHHDFISLRDFPKFWDNLTLTVEVEAKAKERAVLKLMQALRRRQRRIQIQS